MSTAVVWLNKEKNVDHRNFSFCHEIVKSDMGHVQKHFDKEKQPPPEYLDVMKENEEYIFVVSHVKDELD